MAIKVIVELQAKPGRRDEVSSLLERIIATEAPSQHGFLGSARYEALEDPDVLVEIADWESVEARDVHMQQAAANGRICTAARAAGCSGPGHGHQPAPVTELGVATEPIQNDGPGHRLLPPA